MCGTGSNGNRPRRVCPKDSQHAWDPRRTLLADATGRGGQPARTPRCPSPGRGLPADSARPADHVPGLRLSDLDASGRSRLRGGGTRLVVDGHLRGGFALVAFPAKYDNSGIMTFLVDQTGIVYQKNLGPDTARIATQMTEFDPDLTWTTP